MLIGITGQIGTGKSTVAKMLAKKKWGLIDADKVGHDVLQTSATARKRLIHAFGKGIVDESGQIDRTALGASAFASKRNKQRLDAIVHPVLVAKIQRQIVNLRKSHRVVILDAAVLPQWPKLLKQCHRIIVVTAKLVDRRRRVMNRGVSAAQVSKIMKLQPPASFFLKIATDRIANSGNKKELSKIVKRLRKAIKAEL